jgi:hypothetical protein
MINHSPITEKKRTHFMKTTLFTTACAGLGLTIFPLHAEESSTTPTATQTNPTAQDSTAITTYILEYSGGG